MISNECTRGTNMSCNVVTGATTVLSNQILARMTDNGDGTYSYSYSVSVPGKITVCVFVAVRKGVAGEYFDNTSFTPPSVQNLTTDQFYYMWGTGLVTISQSDNISIHFKTYITPFITDTYNFTLVSDAGNMWNFDGYIVNNNINPVGKQTYNYNSVLLNAFQTYTILIDFADWSSNTEIQLYWKTSTVSNQTIPAENLSIPYDASSSPYQITVNCPNGYTVGGSAMNQCIAIIADGLVNGSEKCDDTNTANGDGCSSDDTTIEDGWICQNGSTTHKSDCSKCDAGYEPNTNKDLCVVSDISNEVSIFLIVFLIIFTLKTLMSFVSILRGISSTHSILSGFNQLQLILLLPLIGAFISTKVTQFIAGMKIALNFLVYLSLKELYLGKSSELSYSQSSSYLYLINIKEGSSILNILNFILPILLGLLIYLLLIGIKIVTCRVSKERKIRKLISWLIECIIFGLYIKIICFYYLFLLIISLSELYLFRFNSNDHQASKIFSTVLFLFCYIVVAVCFCQIFSTKIVENEDSKLQKRKCINCFDGLKERKISRIYTLLFFLRRQIFCILILLFKDLKMIIKVSTYSFIQLIYIIILCINRPLMFTKELIIDLINEIIYLVLCILLIHYNSESVWNTALQYAYIWIIIGSKVILLILEIAYCFKCKKTIKDKNTLRVSPDEHKIVNVIKNFNNHKEESKEDQSDLKILDDSNSMIKKKFYSRSGRNNAIVGRIYYRDETPSIFKDFTTNRAPKAKFEEYSYSKRFQK